MTSAAARSRRVVVFVLRILHLSGHEGDGTIAASDALGRFGHKYMQGVLPFVQPSKVDITSFLAMQLVDQPLRVLQLMEPHLHSIADSCGGDVSSALSTFQCVVSNVTTSSHSREEGGPVTCGKDRRAGLDDSPMTALMYMCDHLLDYVGDDAWMEIVEVASIVDMMHQSSGETDRTGSSREMIATGIAQYTK
eukprot:4564145-Pleurochrysis_carterae.AAC.2